MQCTSYDHLMIEFLSFLSVNWDGQFRGQEVDITFHMFNIDYWMCLRMFNELLKLPMADGAYRDISPLWRPDPIWLSITCSKQKAYMDRFGKPRAFHPRQAKATDICNINLYYLQCLTTNIIFGRNGNQNGC